MIINSLRGRSNGLRMQPRATRVGCMRLLDPDMGLVFAERDSELRV